MNEPATEAPGDPFEKLRSSKPWLDAIADYERSMSKWNDKCDNIEKAYANLEKLSGANAEREMQVFWANLEVLKPSFYARPPVPVVGPRFKDRKPLIRHASELLERCIITSYTIADIHQTMKHLRDDMALTNRAVSWMRLDEYKEGEQKVCYDHIDRKDFAHEPARKWEEVGWVARATFKTMEEMRARFEETSGNAYLRAEYEERKDDDGKVSDEKKARVWEIWSKTKNVVVWVTKGGEDVLDIREPFLSLEGFFPCPRPAYGTLQPGTLKPVPDMLFYKDQLEEINELTARISALSEALKLKGFYSAGGEDIGSAVERAMAQRDNQAILIPVPNVAMMGTGLKDAIVWMPVVEVANTITALVALRKQVIEDVYQVTGLSDIMRGATDAKETLGAQQLKAQYGSVRVRDRVEELIRIARDMTRIGGEIIAENFEPQTMLAMSQYDQVPTQQAVMQQIQQIQAKVMQAAQNPQMVAQAQQNPQIAQQMLQQAQGEIQKLQSQVTLEQVFQFLRNERMRPFVIDIETDSTVQPDENAAKQRVSEFLQAMAPLIQQLSAMVAGEPATATFAGEVLKFASKPFRAGRDMEAAIDELVDQMKQRASQPKENPEAKAMEMEMKQRQMEMQAEMQKNAAEAQRAREEHAMEMQKLRMEVAAMREKLSIERESIMMKGAAERQSTALRMEAQRESTAATIAKAKASQKAGTANA